LEKTVDKETTRKLRRNERHNRKMVVFKGGGGKG